MLLTDVLEHLEAPSVALREAARLLVPGGAVFASTINRTLRARLLAVTLGEGIGLIPRGTHDPRLFCRPEELDAVAGSYGLRRHAIQGEAVALWKTLRRFSIHLTAGRSTAVGYSILYRRDPR